MSNEKLSALFFVRVKQVKADETRTFLGNYASYLGHCSLSKIDFGAQFESILFTKV